MQQFPATLQSFSFGDTTVKLWVPDLHLLRSQYEAQQETDERMPFPYWAKLWPSAIAMCRFITANTHLVAHKQVLELAAGLGLPGLVAARYASHVTISDYLPEAMNMITASAAQSGYNNISCSRLDWYSLPPGLTTEVMLLSDINYDPAAFEVLYGVLSGFLDQGTRIILTTPQRLMARPFIEQLLPFCVQQEEIAVTHTGEETFITLLILHKSINE